MSGGPRTGGSVVANGVPIDARELVLLELATVPEAAQRCARAMVKTPGPVVVEDVFYSPGRDCVVLLAAEQAVGTRAIAPLKLVVTARRDDMLGEVYRERYASADPGAATGAALLDGTRLLVERFPSDWKLPSLRWALDVADVGAVVPAVRASRGQPRVLRYLPHRRAVLAYPAAGGGEVVGKLFARPRKAARAWDALVALHVVRHGGDPIVPAPVGRVEDRGLLVMEHVAGAPASDALRQGRSPGRALHASRAAARALARLHDLPPPELPPARARVDDVRRLLDRLRLIAPELVDRAEALLEPCAAVLAPAPARTALVHGAYAPRQLLLDGDRIAIVDVDGAGPGDPAADVGYFMASLHDDAVGSRRPYLRDRAAEFLDLYLAEAPSDALARRAHAHQAVVLIRNALDSICKPRRQALADPSALPHLLLEEAGRCLPEL
jgi:hypothetical protein